MPPALCPPITAAEAFLEYLRFDASPSDSGRVTVSDVYLPCTRDSHGRPLSRCPLRRDFDAVISAPGWRFSRDLFAGGSGGEGAAPALHANGKHPAMRGGAYESTSHAGLFFAGTLMHGHDHKKSSGGFIHGFRYLCRALHRQLEEVEADDAAAAAALSLPPPSLPVPQRWPHTDLAAGGCGLRGLVAALLRRINLSAGLFQASKHGCALASLEVCDSSRRVWVSLTPNV